MASPKANASTLKPGRQKTGGRKRGALNKTTKILRDAVLIAADAVGDEEGRIGVRQCRR